MFLAEPAGICNPGLVRGSDEFQTSSPMVLTTLPATYLTCYVVLPSLSIPYATGRGRKDKRTLSTCQSIPTYLPTVSILSRTTAGSGHLQFSEPPNMIGEDWSYLVFRYGMHTTSADAQFFMSCSNYSNWGSHTHTTAMGHVENRLTILRSAAGLGWLVCILLGSGRRPPSSGKRYARDDASSVPKANNAGFRLFLVNYSVFNTLLYLLLLVSSSLNTIVFWPRCRSFWRY